ncbi:response regulator, partial [Spirulina sp. 06S082]|uniref:response regulator n=1 Tax=Spirulina sp. 06S082 TaxID=3110248 RepID=UPI002B1F7201
MNNETITILIVDDQPSNLKFLARLLQNQGYRVRRAISGELALNAAFASPPDLILLDILMPEINGYEVCERLKKDRRTENIPIIFISVIDRADEKVRAFKAGGVDYITKPFQANEVLARIDHQLTIRKLQQQLETQNTQLKAEINQRSIAQQETQLLLELSRSFTRCPDFETALEEALSRLCQTLHASYAEAWIEKDSASLHCARTWSGNQQRSDQLEAIAKFQQNSATISLDKEQGLIGRVWHQCQPEWLHDLSILSPDIFTRAHLAQESGFKTVLAVPVTITQSLNNPKLNDRSPETKPKVLAVLAFFSTDRERDRHWFDLVVTIAAQLGTIVQQKQAEENLRISEEKFAKAFSSSPHAIALKTFPEGRYLDANESFFELLGYSRSEIIGFCARDLKIWVHPQQRDLFHRKLTEEEGILRNLEVEFRTKFGQIKTLLLSAELID